jgi:hypothetical protein
MKDIGTVLADIECRLLEASGKPDVKISSDLPDSQPNFAKGAKPGRGHEIIVAIEKRPGEWHAVWGHSDVNRQPLAKDVLGAVLASMKALGRKARAAVLAYEPIMGDWEEL